MTNSKRNLLLVASGSILLAVLGTLGLLFGAGWLTPPSMNQQAMVHNMGHQVMPFDLSQTTHIFEMTDSGGIQQVIAKDPGAKEQISLIQQHLQHEAMRFSGGDFSDPTSLHGAEMPGIKELAGGVAQVKIEYTTLPNGAQITFTTQDLHLITAIHRWFGAQLSDHGSDATYR
ncbi:MAG: hypothetical protein BroJett011_49510 [Chloroflexota bacterium]|nr:MAG: hypothetical protein BroJett011_49510 [Chloroflexota bacterium]